MREVGYLEKLVSDLRRERADFLVRALQKLVEQLQLVHDLEGRGVDRIPRKSRRKSACFSRTRTETPARARRKPSIIRAGPPPAMQQRTETSESTMTSLA